MNKLLSQKEQTVLACLFQIHKGAVNQISKETTINRTSLYPILGKLMEKGLVSSFIQDGITVYEAIEPEAFKSWLKNKTKEITEETVTLANWLKSVSSEQAPSLISKIKYYEGFEGVKAMYADTWRNNKNKMIYAITDVRAVEESMSKYTYKEYMPERIAHGVRVKDIMTDNKEGRKAVKISKQYLREAKLAKGLFENLGIEINIYDNKMAIAAYNKQKPCGVIIENEKIASAMKNIFEHLWKLT
jgi:sugar-specific transcriptional regulator TrmB